MDEQNMKFDKVEALLESVFETLYKDLGQSIQIGENVYIRSEDGKLIFKIEESLLIKMCWNFVSLLRIHPQSRVFYNGFHDIWDISTMWGITRSIVEAYLIIFYLTNPEKDSDCLKARQILYVYHDKLDRQTQFQSEQSTDRFASERLSIQKQCDGLVGKLNENKFHQTYIKEKKKKELKKLYSRGLYKIVSDIALEAGLTDKMFNQFYSISSWHVHTKGQCLSQMFLTEQNRLKCTNRCYETSSIFLFLAYKHYQRLNNRNFIVPFQREFEDLSIPWLKRT